MAQPDPPRDQKNASDDAIVITGNSEPPTRKEVYDQALALSRVDPHRQYEQAMARFNAPLCPGVSGMKAEAAGLIVDRIRDNAARLGVPLAKPKCSPNLVVAFVADGRAFLGELARKNPQMFSLVAAPEREELLSETGPARVWSNVEPRWASGAPLPRWRGEIEWPSVRGSINKFFLPTRTDIDTALILFDREAVLGMTLVQLADYATMRGLSHTRPAKGDEPLPTILALFDGHHDMAELTSFDIGYLRSLYFWRPDQAAVTKLLGVRRRAEKAREDEATAPAGTPAKISPAP